MSLVQGWHQCRWDPGKFAPSGMVSKALIYARTANVITQVAEWDEVRGVYDVQDMQGGARYSAATLKDVMEIAHQREQLRQASAPTSRSTR